jgi:hypothetical protein
MGIDIRQLPVNPNPMTLTDMFEVDPSGGGTYSNTVQNILSCGSGNTSSGNSSITPGGTNNTASGDYSAAIGYGTTASNTYAFSQGYNTTASAIAAHAEGYSTIASGNYSHSGGYGTTASGVGAIAFGINSIAAGNYSTAIGVGANATNYAEYCLGVNNLASPITLAQFGNIGYFIKTIGATANVELFLDGTAATQRFVIATNTAYYVQIQIVGFGPNGNYVSYTGTANIINELGTVLIINGTVSLTQAAYTGTLNGTSASAAADNTNKSLKLEVTGISATNINWIGRVTYLAASAT